MSTIIIPESVDRLTPTGFRLTINSKEFNQLEYFCVGASLPGISLNSVETGFRNNKAFLSGDTIEYGSFSISFIVDEELKNYLQIFKWILNNSQNDPIYLDMTLSILTNQNNTNKQVQFLSTTPQSLSELSFNVQDTSIDYVTCEAEFSYNTFKFIK